MRVCQGSIIGHIAAGWCTNTCEDTIGASSPGWEHAHGWPLLQHALQPCTTKGCPPRAQAAESRKVVESVLDAQRLGGAGQGAPPGYVLPSDTSWLCSQT